MRTRGFIPLVPLVLSAATSSAKAAEAATSTTWHPQSLLMALGYMLLFAFVGIATAVIGYRFFDACTPGDLNKEIIENRNVAAAIVAAAVILGVCIIIAASMLG